MTVMPAPSFSQHPQVIPNQPGSGPSTLATDPAASLREAALQTLKARRRKLGSGSEPAGLPSRPQTVHVTSAEPSIQLDYGQEEPSGASSAASSVPTASPPTKLSTPEPKEDEGQGREEGEISDSESLPASPVVQPKVISKAKLTAGPREISKSSAPVKPPPIRTTSAPGPSSAGDSASSAASEQSASELMPPPPLPLPYLLDANHVRPGLEMTQAQYDAAKDIVLDLLGWGVPPEYLVSCGVSREIMFYVFTELNLRLPPNFDATGIPPYPPVPIDLNVTPTTNVVRRFDSMTLRPANGTANPQANGQASSSQSQPALSATAAAFVPTPSLPAVPNLFDMEQQRRQELLARKAAIASRKKQSAPSTSPTSPPGATSVDKEPKDVEMADAVPTKTVDDFLKSIDAVSEKDSGKGKAPARPTSALSRTTTSDAMDVDEAIPGLSIDTLVASSLSSFESTPLVQSPTPATSTPVSVTRQQSADDSVTSRTNQSTPSVASSGERSPSNISPGGMEVFPGLSFESVAPGPDPIRHAQPVRRGTKRPVAADFDDDARPHISRPPSSHTSRGVNGNPYHQPSFKRNVGSFVGLSNMRRCVIDLSDSEDDEEEEGAIPTTSRRENSSGPSRLSAPTRSGPQSGPSVPVRRSPPSRNSATPTAVLTPAALQEKEEEIRKMRELIAQREQNRLRKQVMVSQSSPPSTSVTPAPNGGPHAPPQLDDGLQTSMSDAPHVSTGSNTPTPPGTVSIPSAASSVTSTVATPIADVTANSLLDLAAGDRGEWLL
ncbi:hypothetical protein DAEQUDRAFT_569138 [Daedalea quercina L-15889]|uniref:Uncharacterized protein n=1 Tax=Daedalea quercina L-15889 TaxID=1314783 RepID=A0A165LW47_9APHY|nr:hypothetical protein DAEQUDRAFT_569138 [Daedalea quercina L-15889]